MKQQLHFDVSEGFICVFVSLPKEKGENMVGIDIF